MLTLFPPLAGLAATLQPTADLLQRKPGLHSLPTGIFNSGSRSWLMLKGARSAT
jgi:hypothetical protein